ncbi:MAG: glycosyltransferase family 2 protein [Pseudomonadales bacterium]
MRGDSALITIVVPVLNMERTICRTIDSILSQSYQPREIIVVDGRSSDSTLEKLRRYGNRIDQLISEPDRGIYDAMNKGIARARGEIIGILNGDDYYANPQVLRLYADRFARSPADLIFADLECFSAADEMKTVRIYSSRRFSPAKLRYGWMPPHPTLFVRNSVYHRIGAYRRDYRISADFEFLVRALWRHQLRYERIDAVVVRMQYGGTSSRNLAAVFRLNREIIRACRSNGLSTGWVRLALKIPRKLLEFSPRLRRSAPRNAS